MSLYEKMFNIMNESEAVEKTMIIGSGKNQYKAVSEAAMLNMVKPLFKKYKLIIFPINADIKELINVYNKTDDYDGKIKETVRSVTQIKVTYRILDTESSESVDVIGVGNGADSQDKGAGKAYTYSLKNALSKTFMLFSGEDTDNEHSDDIGQSPKNNPVPTKGNYAVNVPTKTEPPKADPLKPPVVKSQKPDFENPFLEKAEEIHEKAAWVISKLQKDKLNAIAKIKGVSLATKGFEWTKKESSQFWLEADYLAVLAKLMKLENK